MIKNVTFIKKSLYGDKGETREVSGRAALLYLKLGLIEPFEVSEVKEEKSISETKEEKQVVETKEEKKKVKTVKSPRF
jgi:hypothetical protein